MLTPTNLFPPGPARLKTASGLSVDPAHPVSLRQAAVEPLPCSSLRPAEVVKPAVDPVLVFDQAVAVDPPVSAALPVCSADPAVGLFYRPDCPSAVSDPASADFGVTASVGFAIKYAFHMVAMVRRFLEG